MERDRVVRARAAEMIAMNSSGAAVALPSRTRAERLTTQQRIRRRNADWLEDYEVGRWDPAAGRVVPRSVRLIAQLAGVAERTVRQGIADALKLREALRVAVA